jgi:hypothetical protein
MNNDLATAGCLRFESVLPPEFVAALQAACDAALARHDHSAVAAQGSLLPTTEDPLFADLIAYPPALRCLKQVGFPNPAYSDGYIISKPGGGGRLFWHYDWFAWEDARSYANPAPQLFLMYYLSDTRRENGCLRVIPGSHIAENPLHRLLAEPHSAALSKGGEGVEFSDRPDEVDVPVNAGDLLIGDARLLHAAHANQTDERRTLITLWYQPELEALPPRIQAQMAAKTQPLPTSWPEAAKEKLRPLLASTRYTGSAAPYPRQLWRPQS